MHLEGLDLNLLIALDALLSEKNVTRAAERLHITQPGMSAALQKLRSHFSDELLEPIGRKLELTPRGCALAGPVKSILLEIKSLSAKLDHFDSSTAQRVFRVASSTYCSDLLAVPVIRRLSELAPRISCHFDALQSGTFSRLVEGQLDFAVTIAPGLFGDAVAQDKSLSEEPFFTDRMTLIVAEGNDAVGDVISFDELCDRPYAETRFGNDLVGLGERVWQQQSRAPRVRAWLPTFQLTLDAVSRTDLMAMVPARLVSVYRGRFRVRTLEVPFDVPLLEEQIIWHRRNDTDPGHRWFRNLLKTIVAEQGLNLEPCKDRISSGMRPVATR